MPNSTSLSHTRDFTELIVWQKAHELVLMTYSMTLSFPKEEIYGLTAQFRRAAVSIAANIAEGYAKKGKADKRRYFNISQGSLQECRYYHRLASDLHYSVNVAMNGLQDDVAKLLHGYIRAIDASI